MVVRNVFQIESWGNNLKKENRSGKQSTPTAIISLQNFFKDTYHDWQTFNKSNFVAESRLSGGEENWGKGKFKTPNFRFIET